MWKPEPHSNPATCVSAGITSMCQWYEGEAASRSGFEWTMKLKAGFAERGREPAERRPERLRAQREPLLRLRLVVGLVPLRHDPGLEGAPRRPRREHHELVVLVDEPGAVLPLLPDDVAEDAALLVLVVAPRALDLLDHLARHDRQRDELRVGVVERGAGQLPLVLEEQDVAEAQVVAEVEDRAP